jgi:hypothetical protein
MMGQLASRVAATIPQTDREPSIVDANAFVISQSQMK